MAMYGGRPVGDSDSCPCGAVPVDIWHAALSEGLIYPCAVTLSRLSASAPRVVEYRVVVAELRIVPRGPPQIDIVQKDADERGPNRD